MAFNRKQRLRDNIEAIRTAFILDRERRTATAEEQAILRKYCGFGGLKCILNPAKELTDAVHWAKSDLELFAPTVELHRLVRENSKDDTEYKRYADAMKQSVLTAFYTPPEITGTIAEALHEHGIRPDRVLEPSAGVGAFVDAVLENKPDADIMAFEKDLMTGKRSPSRTISTLPSRTSRSATWLCSTRSLQEAKTRQGVPHRRQYTTTSS